MEKLKVITISNNDYVLIDNNKKKYKLNMIFEDTEQLKIGDYIYISNNILTELNIFTFGPINYLDNNITTNDLIKVITLNKEYYLQRYYG